MGANSVFLPCRPQLRPLPPLVVALRTRRLERPRGGAVRRGSRRAGSRAVRYIGRTTLYYVSARPAPGEAPAADVDLDIWFVQRDRAGRWGVPQRLPEPVNSPATELLPRLDDRGRLCFGSDLAGGFGGRDIYVATQAGDGPRHVANAGAPISSAAYEYEASPSGDGLQLVVVADRGDRSHHYQWRGERWVERGRVATRDDVFQAGPLLSSRGDRVLFAQADGGQSGELFVANLRPDASREWPPTCTAQAEKVP